MGKGSYKIFKGEDFQDTDNARKDHFYDLKWFISVIHSAFEWLKLVKNETTYVVVKALVFPARPIPETR